MTWNSFCCCLLFVVASQNVQSEACDPVDVYIGFSESVNKTVTPDETVGRCPATRGLGCRINTDWSSARDTFQITVANGLDDHAPWGMELKILCRKGKYPPPPCLSYALVQATVGVGTVLIWYPILIRYQI